jgi:putative membrane protein
MIRMRVQHFFRAVILAAFAIFFIELTITGEITKYINPKYDFMSKITASVFILFFFVQISRVWEKEEDSHVHCTSSCTHDHGYVGSLSKKLISYGILILPLFTGFTFAPTVLGSSIASNKGSVLPQVESNVSDESLSEADLTAIEKEQEVLPNNNIVSEEEYDQRLKNLESSEIIQMDGSIFSSYLEMINRNPALFEGRKIKVSGFVYKEDGFEVSQLVVSRFLITHCVADASVIGFLTEFKQASKLEQDTWLEIEGTLEVTTYNGVTLPLIKADEWTVIEEPIEPYIYPVITKLIE